MKYILLGLIRVYQAAISPLLGPCCRFHPSCSRYAAEAIQTHGIFRGLILAGRRILRCHPFHPGGLDPVPTPARTPGFPPPKLCGTVAGVGDPGLSAFDGPCNPHKDVLP